MADLEGKQFGNYKLISYLGDGSFADVYLGEHVYLNKQVAVKVMRVQLPNSDRESFFIEARTVANLEHPHIVKVLDCGIEERVPYLVMNHASHGTLRQRHPDHTVLSPTTVLSYVKQIASALQYAHGRNLIHRDIKPHNLLLGPKDELWLSDFGLVLIAHGSVSQITQNIAGTPGYMAPEQFIGKSRPASDQYALAVVAYEWLCGERPFLGTYSELFNQHTFAPVPSLREKVPSISPAIEEVVLTALAKDPHQRFASVQAFANALEQAYLFAGAGSGLPAPSSQKGLPPTAKQPISIIESFDTEAPTVQAPIGSFPSTQDAIAIALNKFSSTSEDKHAPGFPNTPEPIEVLQEPVTPVPSTAVFQEPVTPVPSTEMSRKPAAPDPAMPPQLQASPKRGISRRKVLVGLAGVIAVGSGAAIAWKFSSSANVAIHGSIATHPTAINVTGHTTTSTLVPTAVPVGTPIFTYHGQNSGVRAAAWSPDGQFIASGGIDHTVHIWKAVSGEEILKTPYSGHTGVLNAVAWSPDGKLIASGGDDSTVHVWNAATGRDLFPPYMQNTRTVRSVAWSPDGKNLASGSEDPAVHVWTAVSGMDLPFSTYPYTSYGGKVISVAWSPNGTLIAAGCLDGKVYVWNPTNGQQAYILPPSSPLPMGERAVAWSPDGKYILSGNDNFNIYLWDTTTMQMAYSFPSGHTNQIQSVAWSPDGQYFASASLDHTVKVWSFATKKLILNYRYHKGQVWSVAWSPDGQRIASASIDGTVQIWKPLLRGRMSFLWQMPHGKPRNLNSSA